MCMYSPKYWMTKVFKKLFSHDHDMLSIDWRVYSCINLALYNCIHQELINVDGWMLSRYSISNTCSNCNSAPWANKGDQWIVPASWVLLVLKMGTFWLLIKSRMGFLWPNENGLKCHSALQCIKAIIGKIVFPWCRS